MSRGIECKLAYQIQDFFQGQTPISILNVFGSRSSIIMIGFRGSAQAFRAGQTLHLVAVRISVGECSVGSLKNYSALYAEGVSFRVSGLAV